MARDATITRRLGEGVGSRWWWLRINRFEFKLRVWAFDLIVERGSVHRNADWGFDGVSVDLPSFIVSVIDPRRLPTWEHKP